MSLAVVVLVGLRDLSGLSVGATVRLCAAIAWFLLALGVLEAIVEALPLRPWFATWLRVPAALAIVVLPLIHGVPAYLESRAQLPSFTLPALVAAAMLSAALVGFAKVPLGYDAAKWARGLVVASAALSTVLLVVHLGTSTMEAVRPGTGPLHVALFVGTWIVTAGFIVLFAARFAGEIARVAPRRAVLVGAAVFAWGVLLSEIDRRVLVSLYEEVHVWLGLLAILGVELGLRFASSALRGPRWNRAGAIAWVIVAVVALASLLRGAPMTEIVLRTELRGVPLGRTLVLLTPRSAPQAIASASPHAALAFDQRLSRARPGPRPNILLVTIDAWRFDALNRATAPKMPFLDGLARQSVSFTRAYAQGNRTAVAMSAIMLGRYSANLDWRLWFYANGRIYDKAKLSTSEYEALSGTAVHTTLPIFGEGKTLAERLHAKGYYTLATPFARENEFFKKGIGFDRGFDDFVDLTNERWRSPSSDKVVRRAIAQRARIPRRRPWFHWVHLYDPHESKQSVVTYGELLRTTDDAIALLVADLQRRGEWDDTVAIFVADHGEALGEHDTLAHGTTLYDEQIRVPLVMRVPGVAPRIDDTLVGAIDVPATLLAMTGANTDDLDGVNLWPLLETGDYPQDRPVFSELHRYMSRRSQQRTGDMKALVWGDRKLVIDRLAGTAELFDLAKDPTESQNLLLAEPETYAAYAALLDSFIGRAEAAHPLP